MKPGLAVVIDQLRMLGMEQEAKWLEHPEAVRRLLESDQTHAITSMGEYEGDSCDGCTEERPVSHDRECWVAAAWRAIGDPRGATDLENARDAALRETANRLPPEWMQSPINAQMAASNAALRAMYSPTPAILMSPTDTPRLQGLAAWLPARGILDKDGNDPNANLFKFTRPLVP